MPGAISFASVSESPESLKSPSCSHRSGSRLMAPRVDLRVGVRGAVGQRLRRLVEDRDSDRLVEPRVVGDLPLQRLVVEVRRQLHVPQAHAGNPRAPGRHGGTPSLPASNDSRNICPRGGIRSSRTAPCRGSTLRHEVRAPAACDGRTAARMAPVDDVVGDQLGPSSPAGSPRLVLALVPVRAPP